MSSIEVKTSFAPGFRIEQETIMHPVEPFHSRMQAISRRVLDLQDQGISEALIKMGWTPPEQERALAKCRCCRRATEPLDHAHSPYK